VVKRRSRPLRIGYFYTDGFVKPSPASYRALQESVDAIKHKYPASEVELVRLSIPDDLGGAEAIKIFLAMSGADGYDRLTTPHLGNDKPDPTLFLPLLVARLPRIVRVILSFLALRVLKDWMMALALRASGRKSAAAYFEWVGKRDEYRKAWLQRVWNSNDLDAIIW
jgi:hypothetical protein